MTMPAELNEPKTRLYVAMISVLQGNVVREMTWIHVYMYICIVHVHRYIRTQIRWYTVVYREPTNIAQFTRYDTQLFLRQFYDYDVTIRRASLQLQSHIRDIHRSIDISTFIKSTSEEAHHSRK